MQYKVMHFPDPPAFPNSEMPPFHSPISKVLPVPAQAPQQNHTISPSQHTPIRLPHLDQHHIFQTQPDSIEHKMDL
eukprot:11272299-Ditylum_brightwellii.AAC.1